MFEELTFGFPILSQLLFLPLAGALVLWLLEEEDLIKNATLAVAAVELFLAMILLVRFVPDSAAMQFAERLQWIPPLGISYHLAVDGISVLFVGLTAFLTLLIVLYSWDTVRYQVKEYFIALLALETTLIGIFVSIDLILFFVFWELMLIPSYFLIKLWGSGVDRQYAALKYVLYTLLGSVFMLVGFVLLNLNYHDWALSHRVEPSYSFDFLQLLTTPISGDRQVMIFWLIFLGLAFKAPIFPFHTWLPDALMEGPIGMAVVLAGIKLGTYGFLRFSLPLLPEASKSKGVVTVVVTLALIAIVYGAIVALIQPDLRRLLAFSSISHLGFCVLGVFALNFQQLAHDDQSGLHHRRPVLPGGVLVPEAAQHQPLGLRRAGQKSAAAGHLLADHRAGLDRAARHQRVRGRISGLAGRLSGALVVRVGGSAGCDFRGRIFSVVLRARDVRSPDEGRNPGDSGPERP